MFSLRLLPVSVRFCSRTIRNEQAGEVVEIGLRAYFQWNERSLFCGA